MLCYIKGFFFVLFLCFFSSLRGEEASTAYVEIEEQSCLPILSKPFALRKTYKMRLANGLQAYLISDPAADQSAAALAVTTGSWEDPSDAPGMAHLVEHMLFLGTEKYPIESEYDRFIIEHGGKSNAFTEEQRTTYLFSIDHSAFVLALDRFADFFKAPLFNASGLARELQAIDQEFSNGCNEDVMRQIFVMKELANRAHPDHQFNIGNKQSLAHIDHAAIEEWYHNHYSADRMTLVLYSSLPLDHLKESVLASFSSIPMRKSEPLQVKSTVTAQELNAHFIYIVPLKENRLLTMAWELPQKLVDKRLTMAEKVVAALLGDEGPHSLFAKLKEGQLIHSLKSGSAKIGFRDEKFIVQIELTKKGVQQLEKIIACCFQAIENGKRKEPPPYLFDNAHRIQKLFYQYPLRENAFDTVFTCSQQLANEELSTYPEKALIAPMVSVGDVQLLLNCLTPQQCQYWVMAPQTSTKVVADRKEKWMEVPYAIQAISEENLQAWSRVEPTSEIDWPEENAFIPSELSVAATAKKEGCPLPKTILDDESGKIYFAQDAFYLTPEAYFAFEIKSPKLDMADASQVILADLYVKALQEAVNALGYPAGKAGMSYEIARTDRYGIAIVLYGYSEKLPLLLETILQQLKKVSLSKSEFQVQKEALLQDYRNASKQSPIERAKELLKHILYKDCVLAKEKASAIAALSYEDFQEYSHSFFKQTYLEGIIYGNMTEAQAQAISDAIKNTLNSKPYLPSKQKKQRVIELPLKEGPCYLEYPVKSQGNGVILTIQQPTSFSFKARAAQQLLSKAIEEPFYTALRTQQQTGYLVYNCQDELERKLFTFFVCQSNSHQGRDLLARFELAIEHFLQEIASELPEERFKTIQQALIQKLQRVPDNIKERGEQLKNLAFLYDGDFDWFNKRIKGMEELTYLECIAIAKSTFGRKNRQRLSILAKGIIPKDSAFDYIKFNSSKALRMKSCYTER